VKVTREGDLYRIVCGQTRLNASRRAGLEFIPAIVLEGSMTPTRLLIEELADNNSTEAFDLLALAEICVELQAENGWTTQIELCRNVPIAKPAQVSKALSIFDNLLDELKAQVRTGALSGRLAYALSRVPRERQMEVYRAVEGMNAQGAEQHISALLAGKKTARAKPVKCRTPHGIVILIPGALDFDTALADLAVAPEAIKRAQRQSLPLATLPMLMRTQAT
jgi:ParB-like chromosome segregation protein Spo0J